MLVTGAGGLLGSWLRRTAPSDAAITSLVHRTAVPDGPTVTADLRAADQVAAAFDAARPDLVIHAAMAVDEASIVTATRHVAGAAAERGTELLFVSTDAVFAGDGVLADEDRDPEPIWDYGRWKVEAERIVLPGAAVVRLPLVVSLDPEDKAVERTRAAAEAGETIAWFADERRQPAMAIELAQAIWRIAGLAPEVRAGVWHLMGPERLTRYEIAGRVAAALGLRADVIRPEPTPPGLVRPRDLFLGSERAREEIGWDPTPILGG